MPKEFKPYYAPSEVFRIHTNEILNLGEELGLEAPELLE